MRWKIVVTAGLMMTASTGYPTPLKVTLISPDPPDTPFWGQAVDFTKAVAEDLDVDLHVVYSNGGSSYAIKRDGLKVIESVDKPDYILTGYFNGATDKLFKAAELYDMHFFIFNTPISSDERLDVDQPRVRYKNWIGHMTPDEVQAGYDLADILGQHAKALPQPNGSTFKVAALSGTADSAVATDRETGLKRRVNSDSRLAITDVKVTSWRQETAIKATEEILTRHPDISIIWAAADALALGAVDVLQEKGLQAGQDVVVGGIDWSNEGIQAVKRGELAVTLGGHFMEGGWALLLAYDHSHGIDFAGEMGTSIVTSMQPITAENVDHYLARFGNKDWRKIDFRRFSKVHNEQLDEYDFSLEALLSSAESSH